jgi:heme-degrading monooxygenase HmoA
MSNGTVEIAHIKLAIGKTETELIAASNQFQHFLNQQSGFLSRHLIRSRDGSYADLVHWTSDEAAMAVGEKIASSADCQAYFALMDFDPAKLMEGVVHYDILAAYRL